MVSGECIYVIKSLPSRWKTYAVQMDRYIAIVDTRHPEA